MPRNLGWSELHTLALLSNEQPTFESRTRALCSLARCGIDVRLLTSASTASAFAISAASMCKELGCSTIEAQAGIGLYAWGAGIMPLFIAPISEELGRRPVYLAAAVTFLLFHVANGA